MTADPVSVDRLYNDPALVRFYDLENAGGADIDCCRRLAADAGSVLDLGCGTGVLAASLGATREVVGVDPAGAMLHVARARAGGGRVTWIEADARGVRLGRRFDLVVLTGHAFQVFLTDEDQRAVLTTIAAHLAPDGRFIFDARNPLVEEWREWTPQASRRRFEDPELGTIKAWNDVTHDPKTGIVTYKTHYLALASRQQWSASSQIRFTGRESLQRRLDEAGLAADQWLGDWSAAPYAAASPEIIPVGRLR
jgi:SAM-dependent methyltransferase